MSKQNLACSVSLPTGQGHLIGNLLRQMVIRGGTSWQAIAYGVDKGDTFSALGTNLSFLSLLSARCDTTHFQPDEGANSDLIVATFTPDNGVLSYKGAVLREVEGFSSTSMQVVLHKAAGAHTAEENHRLLVESQGDENARNFFAVSSRHNLATAFEFEVVPIDSSEEVLSIYTNLDALRNSYQECVNALSTIGRSLGGNG